MRKGLGQTVVGSSLSSGQTNVHIDVIMSCISSSIRTMPSSNMKCILQRASSWVYTASTSSFKAASSGRLLGGVVYSTLAVRPRDVDSLERLGSFG